MIKMMFSMFIFLSLCLFFYESCIHEDLYSSLPDAVHGTVSFREQNIMHFSNELYKNFRKFSNKIFKKGYCLKVVVECYLPYY